MGTEIRAFLMDDHEVVRQGVRALLESSGEIEVVGEASNAAEALARIDKGHRVMVGRVGKIHGIILNIFHGFVYVEVEFGLNVDVIRIIRARWSICRAGWCIGHPLLTRRRSIEDAGLFC